MRFINFQPAVVLALVQAAIGVAIVVFGADLDEQLLAAFVWNKVTPVAKLKENGIDPDSLDNDPGLD